MSLFFSDILNRALRRSVKVVARPLDVSRVSRVEVINHWTGEGRCYVHGPAERSRTELSLQDDGRTLKVFISDPREGHAECNGSKEG